MQTITIMYPEPEVITYIEEKGGTVDNTVTFNLSMTRGQNSQFGPRTFLSLPEKRALYKLRWVAPGPLGD